MPKGFANNAFDAVAIHSPTRIFLGNDQAQTGSRQGVGANKDHETGGRKPERNLVENPFEIVRRQQARGLAKRLLTVHDPLMGVDRSDSDQHLAAFGATTAEDLATILGGHACAETMRALALDNAGLEGSFHRLDSIAVPVGTTGR